MNQQQSYSENKCCDCRRVPSANDTSYTASETLIVHEKVGKTNPKLSNKLNHNKNPEEIRRICKNSDKLHG